MRDSDTATGRDNLLSILWDGRLEARNVYGMARGVAADVAEVADSQRTVCFTETAGIYLGAVASVRAAMDLVMASVNEPRSSTAAPLACRPRCTVSR